MKKPARSRRQRLHQADVGLRRMVPRPRSGQWPRPRRRRDGVQAHTAVLQGAPHRGQLRQPPRPCRRRDCRTGRPWCLRSPHGGLARPRQRGQSGHGIDGHSGAYFGVDRRRNCWWWANWFTYALPMQQLFQSAALDLTSRLVIGALGGSGSSPSKRNRRCCGAGAPRACSRHPVTQR